MAEYKIIDGKATSIAIKKEIAEEVERIVAAGGKRPHLAAVLVGHDGGSETYVKNKVIACEQCGFVSSLIRYEEDVTEEELLTCVNRLNLDEVQDDESSSEYCESDVKHEVYVYHLSVDCYSTDEGAYEHWG